MRSIFLFILIVFLSFRLHAQEANEADTSNSKDCDSLVSLEWLSDSAYGVFRTEKFPGMKTFFLSFKTYRTLIDTSQAGDQSETTQFVMYNTQWNYLRIQFTKMMKKIHSQGIRWDKTTLDSVYYEKGVDHGLNFAYIYWVIKYNNRKSYILSAVAVQYDKKWFLMDELRYGGVVPEKKKPKIRKYVK